jgi:competence protein CoiA
MKFAVVEGKRREAQPHLSGKCPRCGDAMTARCGDVRVWHWAHRGTRTCDPWWESETEWHRDWKNQFPEACQEFRYSKDGEVHIADVKTESGVVLEFQHSHLHRNERESRENFYRRMVWVVDGLRRVRDKAKFIAFIRAATIVRLRPLIYSVTTNEGALLRDWAPSRVPVFFDFGDPILWRLSPRSPNGWANLSPVLKTTFLDALLKGQPLKGMPAARPFIQQAPQSRGATGFQQYMARRQRARRRF